MSTQELDTAILRMMLASPTIAELATKLNASTSAVAKALSRLTAGGFIELVRDQDDGRIQRPTLTLWRKLDELGSALASIRGAAC